MRQTAVSKHLMKIDSENIINFLTKRIPELKYSLEKKNILNIEPNDSNGFGIKMIIDSTESTIFFGNSGHHIHCYESSENIEEYLNLIVNSLTGTGRIVAHISNGKEFKWEYQEMNENNDWITISEMGTFSWKFWKKRKTDKRNIQTNNYKQKTFANN